MAFFLAMYVARCRCGLMPLNSHTTWDSAYQDCIAHHDLNPALCKPWVSEETVPVTPLEQ